MGLAAQPASATASVAKSALRRTRLQTIAVSPFLPVPQLQLALILQSTPKTPCGPKTQIVSREDAPTPWPQSPRGLGKAPVAILDDGLTHQQRESARIGCFMHLRDLTNSHPNFAPTRAVEFVRQREAAALERLRERQRQAAR